MQIELYSHNADAYKNAVALLQTEKKAAVIHPTGTGKSFIAFKLCADNPDKNICWLSPSEYIFKTQLENLKKAANGYEPENITFFTYAKLMNMSIEKIRKIKPDYIILDEFHRCGAEVWGQGVNALLSSYPTVPVLGLSATAVRYLDNQRNMADELFDGHIASEMSLGEAIVRGILAPPKYVLSAFSCQKDLEKYKRRVSRAKNKAVRDMGEKYLEALRRALDKADGLDEIFDKHMTERGGKYIVFCADYEHMCHMRELAPEWFGRVDKNPHIYSFYSEEPAADTEFKAFKADRDDSHLRLLYCIDALNEGVHIDDISGVIMLRPTVSPIIYKQQIGRALQAGVNQSSVIFDIVLNIENLYSIGAIQEEMRLAVSYYRSIGQSEKIQSEHFRVIDEVRDCLSLFDKLNETLTASWEYMYDEAKKYYEKYGNLDVPKRYKTENGYQLGSWILTQRRVHSGSVGGVLTLERIDKLNKIGMIWESRRDMQWQMYYDAARRYSGKYGNLNVPASYITADGIRLGCWIANLRTARKNGFDSKYLTEERVETLNKIGMVWEVSDYLWQRYYGACLTYKGTYGNLNIPHRYVTGDGLKLGAWLSNIRSSYNRQSGRLSEEQISALEALGIVWNKKQDLAWEKGYRAARQYFEKCGNLNVPVSYKAENGYALGKWLDRIRHSKKISENQKASLESIGMIWEKESSWDIRFGLAKKYFEKNGSLNITTDYKENGIWLGKWLSEQKKKYKSGELAPEYVQRLEQIGVDWDSSIQKKFDDMWESRFCELEEYYGSHGSISGLAKSTVAAEKNLNVWLVKQRRYYREGKLSQKKIKRLEKLGMDWLSPTARNWENCFESCQRYYEKYGNVEINANYTDENGACIGRWLKNQQKNYTKLKTDGENGNQIERLESIGVVFGPKKNNKKYAVARTA